MYLSLINTCRSVLFVTRAAGMLKSFVRWSHVGRRKITLEPNVTVEVTDALGPKETYETTQIVKKLTLNGPLGSYSYGLHKGLAVEVKKGFYEGENIMNVIIDKSVYDGLSKRKKNFVNAMWGTTAGILKKQAEGVVEGFTVNLKIVGVGYRATLENNQIALKIGFCHLVYVAIPADIKVAIPNPNKIVLFGLNYHKVTQFAASIRSKKKPEPYNGKGIFIGDETIKRKEGKKK